MKVIGITDFGFDPQFQDTATGEVQGIGRYGVWNTDGDVIETGNDLEALLEKYNLTMANVKDLSHLIPQPPKR